MELDFYQRKTVQGRFFPSTHTWPEKVKLLNFAYAKNGKTSFVDLSFFIKGSFIDFINTFH